MKKHYALFFITSLITVAFNCFYSEPAQAGWGSSFAKSFVRSFPNEIKIAILAILAIVFLRFFITNKKS